MAGLKKQIIALGILILAALILSWLGDIATSGAVDRAEAATTDPYESYLSKPGGEFDPPPPPIPTLRPDPTSVEGCENPPGVSIPHEICKRNPAPPSCGSIRVAGGMIPTVCSNGCCKAAPGYTTGQQAAGGTGGILGTLAQIGSSLLGQLFGGSSGETSSGGGNAIYDSIENTDSTNGFLQYDTSAQEDVFADTSFLSFGSANDDELNDFTLPKPSANQGTETSDSGSSVSVVAANTQAQKQTQEGDTVSTAYEYLNSLTGGSPKAVGSGGSVGGGGGSGAAEIDASFGATLEENWDSGENRGLSLYELEANARQQAGYQSLNTNSTAPNYRSSTLAQRSGADNPLSSDRYDIDTDEEESTEPNWWQKLILAITGLLSGK